MTPARIALVAIVAACNTGEPARPEIGIDATRTSRDFANGSRLRARVWDVGGMSVLRDFYDSTRGEPCAFVDRGLWHVGPGPTYYCLPLGVARHDRGIGAFAVFRDSACSEPLAVSPAEGSATYAIVRPADACAAAPELHLAGKATTRVPWVFDGSSCRWRSTWGPARFAGVASPAPRARSSPGETSSTSRAEKPASRRSRSTAPRAAFRPRPPRFVRSTTASGARVFEVTRETDLFEVEGGTCRRHVPVVPVRGLSVTEVDVTRFAIAVERDAEP
ncbi:MAG: hypothetical protein K0S65_473 [Labilithrix sp.]|nr:hypothetical protein [Labilithrix sp.]